jgi:hypothetical protein
VAALLAVFVAGLWGGLAGYLWLLADALPPLLGGRPLRLLETDYFEGRFFGEYSGPSSELVAYLCSPPLYHRELALVLLWPALGLAYGRPGARALLAAALLGGLAAAVYPYMVFPVLLLLWLSGGPALTRQPRVRAVVAAGMLVAAFAADQVVRQSRGHGILQQAVQVLVNPDEREIRARDFGVGRVVSGHFFMGLAMYLALRGLSRDERAAAARWPGRRILWPSLALTAAVIALNLGPPWARAYRWLNPWRALVEPVLILGTALALERLFDEARRGGSARRRALLLLLLLAPTWSVLNWTAQVALFLRWDRPDRPRLYDAFAGYGSQVLGKLQLRGPLLIEAAPVIAGDYAQAAFGVPSKESRATHDVLESGATWGQLLAVDRQADLLASMRSGAIGDILLLRGGRLEAELLRSGECALLGGTGPYDILRVRPPRGQ